MVSFLVKMLVHEVQIGIHELLNYLRITRPEQGPAGAVGQ